MTDTMRGWLTNDPIAARMLRAADRGYQRRLSAAQGLALAQKAEAIKAARLARAAAYDAVWDGRAAA